MLIAAEDGKTVLQRERRNPDVIGRNWTAQAFERDTDSGVKDRGFVGDGEDVEMAELGAKPRLVSRSMPGLRNTVAEFSEHDDGDGCSRLQPQDIPDTRIPIHERGQRVRVQDQVRSSGSITSNVSSILAWMRAVSLRKRRSFPKPCIHPGSPGRFALAFVASFSRSASVTSSFSVWPRSAAFDFAFRNSGTGFSIVVFIDSYYN